MRRMKIVHKLRPFLPVIIGISLGFSMSIVRMPISHEDCVHLSKDNVDRKLNSISRPKDVKFSSDEKNVRNEDFEIMSKEEAIRYRKDRDYAPQVYDTLEDFEPRIITDPELKPKAEVNKKKIVRPRYISTELGIREKLVCAVLTSASTFSTLGMAMNKTFSHHMQKVIFFDGVSPGAEQKPPAAEGITLILHPVSSPVKILYHTLTYLHTKFKDTYDWYYITTDRSYSEADRIVDIVDHISINRRLYMGKPLSFADSLAGSVTYCNVSAFLWIGEAIFLQ